VNENGPSSSALRPPGTMAGFPPPMAFIAGPLAPLEDSPPPHPAPMLIPPTLILILGQSLLPPAPDDVAAAAVAATQLPSLVFLFTPDVPGAWAPDAAVVGVREFSSSFFCFCHPESALDPPTLDTDNLGLPSIMSLFSLSSLINLHGTGSLFCPPGATFPSAAAVDDL